MRHTTFLLFSLLVLALITSFQFQSNQANEPISYLALGDSYTIGESVENNKNWPHQLVDSLRERKIDIAKPKVIAETGWRTDDMLKAARKEVKGEKYDMISLLIGVNNEYQGWDPKKFEPEFEKCLKYAIIHSKYGKDGVFVVSIPDYGFTPFGKKNQKKISKRLDQYNVICKRISNKYDVKYFNITPISRSDPNDNSLVAKDGLHPSAKQYSLWVDQITEGVMNMIGGFN